MSMTSIGFDIFAKDRASATFDKVGKTVGETQGKFSKSTAAIGVGAAVAATAVIAFGKKSIDTFANVGGESLKLQRYMGGTIEDASRLRYAGTQSGVGVDVLTVSMGKLSKSLVASGGNAKSSAAMTKLLGFSAKDAHGKMLPMSDLMPKLADKFKAMPAGAEKTALALKLFGKGGMAMLPMLNKGAAGMKDMAAESDKFGNTLNTKDTAAIKENVKQKRQMNAAMEGLQIMLGRVLMPAVVKISTKLAEMAKWVNENARVLGPLLTIVGGFAAIIFTVTKAMKAWAAIQAILNLELWSNPIGLVVLAIAALIGGIVLIATKTTWFQTAWAAMTSALGAAWQWLWNTILAPVIRFILNGFANITAGIASMLHVLGNIPGFGWAKTAADKMDAAAAKARALADGIKDIKSKSVTISVKYMQSLSAAALITSTNKRIAAMQGRASGGPVRAGTSYLINEEGQEIFTPDRDGQVTNARDTARLLAGRGGSSAGGSGGGGDIRIYVNGQVYGSTTDLANVVLNGLQQLKGRGTRLGLA